MISTAVCVTCPNCNSDDVDVSTDDGVTEYECFNCGKWWSSQCRTNLGSASETQLPQAAEAGPFQKE